MSVPNRALGKEINDVSQRTWQNIANTGTASAALLRGNCERSCRDALGKLLRFQSSKSSDKLTSLQDVVSRMKPGQKDIYFVSTENKEAAESSPFVERLANKDFEVMQL